MIGVFSFLSLRYAQFVYKYTNVLDDIGADYELVYWNRDDVPNPGRENWISFNYSMNSFQPFYRKIHGFCLFSRFMRKRIREKKYEKIIILITQTAIPLIDILLHDYRDKYIYDYRDITYENIKIYKMLVDNLVRASQFTSISSKGFLEFLNSSDKFIISHNTREFKCVNIPKSKSKQIRVVYWGMVRQLEFNYKLCDLFSRDERFQLVYHGAGYHKELQDYCKKNKYKNITITGAYVLEDIEKFVKETDIILNCYENDKKQQPAMTVKFYDSVQYGIPMLVTKGSYMSEYVERYKIGFSFNVNDVNQLDELFTKYRNFDEEDYKAMLEVVRAEIRQDDTNFRYALTKFVKESHEN